MVRPDDARLFADVFIRDLRIWSVARSQEQLQKGMRGVVALSPELTAFYPFNGHMFDMVSSAECVVASGKPGNALLPCPPTPGWGELTSLLLGNEIYYSLGAVEALGFVEKSWTGERASLLLCVHVWL